MRSKSTRGDSPALLRARRQFQKWRRAKRGRERIPQRLWSVAAAAAARDGLSKTARELGLSHPDLKAQVQRRANGFGATGQVRPEFVQLPLTAGSGPECIVEAEDGSGRKLRIHLRGGATGELVSLSRALWQPER